MFTIKSDPTAARPAAAIAPVDPDFRVRAAGEKRARMRARLIDATMTAYLKSDRGRPPVIDNVIRIAGVSRGTFYKYFDTLDEVLADIARSTAGEMLTSYARLFGSIDDAAVRLAAGPLMAMARAAMEPAHGAIVANADLYDASTGEDPRRRLVEDSLNYGRAQGVFRFESLVAAFDLVIGTSVEGARRISRSGVLETSAIRETVALVLMGLGLDRTAAVRAVAQAWQCLQQAGHQLDWWKPVSSARPESPQPPAPDLEGSAA